MLTLRMLWLEVAQMSSSKAKIPGCRCPPRWFVVLSRTIAFVRTDSLCDRHQCGRGPNGPFPIPASFATNRYIRFSIPHTKVTPTLPLVPSLPRPTTAQTMPRIRNRGGNPDGGYHWQERAEPSHVEWNSSTQTNLPNYLVFSPPDVPLNPQVSVAR